MINRLSFGAKPAIAATKPQTQFGLASTNLLSVPESQQRLLQHMDSVIDGLLTDETGLSRQDARRQLAQEGFNRSLNNDVAAPILESRPQEPQAQAGAVLAENARRATYALQGDASFTPPLSAFKRFKEDGTALLSMATPPRQEAQKLMNDPAFHADLMAVLPFAQYWDLERLKSGTTLVPTDMPAEAGQDGYGMLQTVAAIEMAKRVGVGVSTYRGFNNGLAAKAI
jgi:hypothetical protein